MPVFVVFALPKSASRAVYKGLLAMQPDGSPVVLGTQPGYPGWAAAMELQPHVLETTENRLLHSHAGALPVTVNALLHHGVRHLVMVRHPADHLAALYCHLRRMLIKNAMAPDKSPPGTATDADLLVRVRKEPARWHSVIHPVHVEPFSEGAIEDGLDHLIRDGYLAAALNWVAGWQRFADPALTRIVRYEDLVRDPVAITADAYRHLWQDEPARLINPLSDRPASPPSIYPRGTTAEPGVWQRYFTPANVAAYNELVERWTALHGDVPESLFGSLILN